MWGNDEEMVMKNILLLVHDDEGQNARLQTALDLVRALDGHLTCVDVTPPPLLVEAYYDGVDDTVIMKDESRQEATNKAALTARLAREDVRWSWIDATGNIARCVIEAATLADLIVLNRSLGSRLRPDMESIANKILMEARKPVVAVPPKAKGFKAPGRALIAWDGQASAAATMRACVPLLKLASEVRLFLARVPEEPLNHEEAAEYLSRHGIHASVQVYQGALRSVPGLIADEARMWHADYIVMGAYSRGRLRETFGGVTKTMLAKSRLPLVLGH